MEPFGRKIERKQSQDKLLETWVASSSPDEFFLRAAVEVPEAKKIDLLCLKWIVWKRNHPAFDGSFALPASAAVAAACLLAPIVLWREIFLAWACGFGAFCFVLFQACLWFGGEVDWWETRLRWRKSLDWSSFL